VVGDILLPTREIAPEKARIAFARLCEDYWPPLYRFVRQRGYSRHDAQDLTQGFFAYLLEKQAYGTPDRSKGRFRTFLLVLLKRIWERPGSKSPKAHGGMGGDSSRQRQTDTLERQRLMHSHPMRHGMKNGCSNGTGHDPDKQAMAELSAEYSGGLKSRLLAELRPFLLGGGGLPTPSCGDRLGVPMDVARHLFRLRCYRG
jgi:RNA polymerase sigma-70 factor (ECF subfamily)